MNRPARPGRVADSISSHQPRERSASSRPVARMAWAVVLSVLLVALPSGPAPSQEPPPGPPPPGDPESIDANGLRGEYEAIVEEEAELLGAYEDATQRLSELLPKVAAAEDALDRANLAALDAHAKLEVKRTEADEAEQRLDEARARVSRAKARLRAYAVEMYMGDSGSNELRGIFEVLDGYRGSIARQGYRATIDDKQAELIHELLNARRHRDRAARSARWAARQAERQAGRVDDLRARARQVLDETTRLAREAANEQTRQTLLVADIRSRKVGIEARIISLEKAADGIASLLAEYQKDDEDWIAGSVDIRIPLEGGKIGSEFGMRAHPILGITRLHAGGDIGASMGDPVLAAGDGIVVMAEARGGYGNTVVIAHGHSLGTVYAHNSSITVEVGDQVQQGQEIARAGSTGLSTGPHVHFETRLRGVPVNPRNFLLPGDATHGQIDTDGDGTPDRFDPDPDDPEIDIEDFLAALAGAND